MWILELAFFVKSIRILSLSDSVFQNSLNNSFFAIDTVDSLIEKVSIWEDRNSKT